MLSAQIKQVATGQTLHHPEVRPASGKNTVHLAAADDLINSEQNGQLILGITPKQSLLAGTTEATGAPGSAETFQQRPAVSSRIEIDLHLRMSGMDGGAQVTNRASCRSRTDKQGSMHRLNKRAFP